jgi:hypothetical protein
MEEQQSSAAVTHSIAVESTVISPHLIDPRILNQTAHNLDYLARENHASIMGQSEPPGFQTPNDETSSLPDKVLYPTTRVKFVRKHHGSTLKNQHSCDSCEGSYCKAHLRLHRRTKHGQTRYYCSYTDCRYAKGAGLSSKNALTAHIKRHDSNRRESIPNRPQILPQHSAALEPIKHLCPLPGCEKAIGIGLPSEEDLRDHIKDHHGLERIYCPYQDCRRSTGLGLSSKKALARHSKDSHSSGAYFCHYVMMNWMMME